MCGGELLAASTARVPIPDPKGEWGINLNLVGKTVSKDEK